MQRPCRVHVCDRPIGGLCGVIPACRLEHEAAPAGDKGLSESPVPQRPSFMLPTEELFVYVYVLVPDLMLAGAGGDANLRAIRVAGHLGGRRGGGGSLAGGGGEGGPLSPALRGKGEANRRTRWLWGVFE